MCINLLRTGVLVCAGMMAAVAEPYYPQLREVDDNFFFVLNADPQIGPADSPHANERRLQQQLAEFVAEVNAMQPPPAFVVFNGDLVAFPREAYFADFNRTVKDLVPPVVLVHGNHDGKYPDRQFYEAQDLLCGFRAAYYAFDCGQWRFVVLPGHELIPKEEFTGPMMNWLREELAAHRERPVMVFLHYHLLPVGLTQSEYYTLPFDMKTELVDAFVRHGNVRCVISGHVHAGIQSSIKSSWNYRGTQFIIAPSPVEPRNFGEEYPVFLGEGQRNEGYYLTVHVTGDKAQLTGRKIGREARWPYPDNFPEFSEAQDPRALAQISRMQGTPTLVNGNFTEGLAGWMHPHRYMTDTDPGYAVRVTNEPACRNGSAAYLYVHEKGHAWAYDESMELFQVVAVPENGSPLFRAGYFSPVAAKSYFGGAYIRLTGYRDETPACTFVFHWGGRESRVRHVPQVWSYHDVGKSRGLPEFHRSAEKGDILSWSIPDYPHRWHDLEIDLAYLYDKAHETPAAFAELGVTKILVKCGVWCGMEPGSFSSAYFDSISLDFTPSGTATVNGKELRITSETFMAPYGGWYLNGHDK